MERTQTSPSGVILRLAADLWPNQAPGMLFSVHFSCVPMPSAPSVVNDANDADFFFDSPFSNILHRSRSEREREARRMIIHVAGNLVLPDDIRFLLRAFCDYSEDVLENSYCSSRGCLFYISVLLQIPDAVIAAAAAADVAATAAATASTAAGDATGGPNDPLQLEIVFFGAASGSCRETSCAICIDDFKPNSVLSVMPCGHGFHAACLNEWLTRSNSCPLCRSSLPAAN
ncbi:uncharacterized protein LOC141812966 [Curcuma longa]|uniref:uncharacterized protein LOC141812966 n=1 Tax=Curcuma longa TaxID=136217 RepID=UPI003D9DE512